MKAIKIKDIKIDESFFIRDGYDGDAIERYKEQFSVEKPELPPLILQKDTSLLIDGFHRLRALTELGEEYAFVEFIETDDPFAEAVERNIGHGVPLTKRERNQAIEKLYTQSNMTQQAIADMFGLNRSRVSQILGTLETNDTSETPEEDAEEPPDKRRTLNDAERNEITELCLVGEKSQTEIGDLYAITQQRVSQIYKEFKDEIHTKYLSGYPLAFIVEDTTPELTPDQVTDILKSYEDIDSDLIKIPRIINGDMFEEISKVPDGSVDLIYADPPHNITKEEWDQFETPEEFWDFTGSWIKTVLTKLKGNGRFYVSFSQQGMFDFYELMKGIEAEHDLSFTNVLVWHHPNNMEHQGEGVYKRTWDPVFFYRKPEAGAITLPQGTPWEGRIGDYDCWKFATPQTNYKDEKQHLAQKPLDLLKMIILTGSEEGELILDPFAGSGTTAVACIETNRNYVVIEKEEEYVKIIEGRVRDALGK